MDVYSVCPKLMVTNLNGTTFAGFLDVLDEDLFIDISLKAPNVLEDIQISAEWKLQQILQKYNAVVQHRIEQSENLAALLLELKNIVEQEMKNMKKSLTSDFITADYSDRLLKELEEVGWERLSYINGRLTEIHFLCHDEAKRAHYLKVHLDAKYPVVGPTCKTELPQEFNFTWNSQKKLRYLVDQFVEELAVHQDLWNCLDDIDDRTWIIEPEKPTRDELYRRIALSNTTSVVITVNDQQPTFLPLFRFLGPDKVIGPLKEKLNSNIFNWNPEQSLFDNLQNVLEVEFPSNSTFTTEEMTEECAICYSYRLGSKVPTEVCNNEHCCKRFHNVCLYEWLCSVPDFRKSYNLVFGECPYCTCGISAPTPE